MKFTPIVAFASGFLGVAAALEPGEPGVQVSQVSQRSGSKVPIAKLQAREGDPRCFGNAQCCGAGAPTECPVVSLLPIYNLKQSFIWLGAAAILLFFLLLLVDLANGAMPIVQCCEDL